MTTTKPLIISDLHIGSTIPENIPYEVEMPIIWITLEEHTKTYPQPTILDEDDYFHPTQFIKRWETKLQEKVDKPKKLRKLYKQKQEKPFWVNDWRDSYDR